jgi:Holliday junction resolvasome RuvABC DNA-binding subunit
VEDAVAALTSLGYSDKEARKSVERATARVRDGNLEALVRAALNE